MLFPIFYGSKGLLIHLCQDYQNILFIPDDLKEFPALMLMVDKSVGQCVTRPQESGKENTKNGLSI